MQNFKLIGNRAALGLSVFSTISMFVKKLVTRDYFGGLYDLLWLYLSRANVDCPCGRCRRVCTAHLQAPGGAHDTECKEEVTLQACQRE